MSFAQNITTQVKRFACDRCHGQKLRCPRRADGGLHEPCGRCCKAGTPCGITTPLRMGGPNKSRKLNTGERVPSPASSPSLNPSSRTKNLETRPHSETYSESGQLQNHSKKEETIDHTSRSSSVNLTPYETFLSIDIPTCSDTAEPATPIAMNDFLQYFDFDLEFTDARDSSMFDDEIGRIRTKSCEASQSERSH